MVFAARDAIKQKLHQVARLRRAVVHEPPATARPVLRTLLGALFRACNGLELLDAVGSVGKR
jgi:hypothetical protein